jgi:hypothetical protein
MEILCGPLGQAPTGSAFYRVRTQTERAGPSLEGLWAAPACLPDPLRVGLETIPTSQMLRHRKTVHTCPVHRRNQGPQKNQPSLDLVCSKQNKMGLESRLPMPQVQPWVEGGPGSQGGRAASGLSLHFGRSQLPVPSDLPPCPETTLSTLTAVSRQWALVRDVVMWGSLRLPEGHGQAGPVGSEAPPILPAPSKDLVCGLSARPL